MQTSNSMFDRIREGRTDLVFEFVASGAAATSTDGRGVSLMQWCATHGDVSGVRFLLGHGESLASLGPNLGLVNAVFHGHWQLSEFLLESGAEANHVETDTGETPLHFALSKPSQTAHERIVAALIQNGADPNRPTKPSVETDAFMRDCRTKGETPLHRAAAFGSEAIIQTLLDAGASREARDMHGDSPLGWASWYLRPRSILRPLCFGGHTVR